MSHFVYRIRRKTKSDDNFGWYSFGREYGTEASARKALNSHIESRMYCHPYENGRYSPHPVLRDGELAKVLAEGYEVVKVEVIHKEVLIEDQTPLIRNCVIKNYLMKNNRSFADFWSHATFSGYADKIEFVIQLDIPIGTDRKDHVMECRRLLRNMDIKTRTFREYQGMFGFYNKDQAFAARLTLNGKEFIDMTEIRREIFGEQHGRVGSEARGAILESHGE